MGKPQVVAGSGRLSPLMARLRARRARRLLSSVGRGRILDVGCGSYPLFLTGTTNFEERVGLDLTIGSHWTEASMRGLHLLVADAIAHLPFRDAQFDAMTLLAVVEHIDPVSAPSVLGEFRRVLIRGGRLVVTTPSPWSDPILRVMAKMGLASSTQLDEHQAYYSAPRLRRLLLSAGFSEARSGYFEASLNVWALGVK